MFKFQSTQVAKPKPISNYAIKLKARVWPAVKKKKEKNRGGGNFLSFFSKSKHHYLSLLIIQVLNRAKKLKSESRNIIYWFCTQNYTFFCFRIWGSKTKMIKIDEEDPVGGKLSFFFFCLLKLVKFLKINFLTFRTGAVFSVQRRENQKRRRCQGILWPSVRNWQVISRKLLYAVVITQYLGFRLFS